MKTTLTWIKEKGICQKITEFAFEYLGKAFKNFFSGRAEYPKFKKKGVHDSFTINAGGKVFGVGGTRIKLPTIGWVKTYESLPHTTTKSLTISQIAGDWFLAFAYEQQTIPTEKSVDFVGVDLGIKTLATLSTSVVFVNPKAFKLAQGKLARLQKQLSRKLKGSKRRDRQRIQVAKSHRRVSNIRKDATHKATTFICKNHAVVGLEDLNVSGMMQNHKLAQALGDANFYEFRRQIDYKSLKFGATVVFVDKFYPSSKTCSNCGAKKETLLLSERVFECSACEYITDRDLNASINLEKYARQAMACKDTEGSMCRHTPRPC